MDIYNGLSISSLLQSNLTNCVHEETSKELILSCIFAIPYEQKCIRFLAYIPEPHIQALHLVCIIQFKCN